MTDILDFLRRFFGLGKRPEAKEEDKKGVEEKESIGEKEEAKRENKEEAKGAPQPETKEPKKEEG